MANIIDGTYFTGLLAIAQSTEASVVANLTSYINKHEPELLRDLLGFELYKNYLAGILADSQIYKDIRDGKEYTNYFGRPDKWRGLTFTVNGTKRSLIANYVYYHYLLDNMQSFTGTGVKILNAENATPGNTKQVLCQVWNEMVEMNKELFNFLTIQANYSIYPEFQVYYGWSGKLAELLEFINPLF